MQQNNATKPKLADNADQAMEQLASIIASYSEITERMQSSHQKLQGEVKLLREELRHKNEMLQRKSRLAALGEMAAGVAHEIRNPLGGVQLYASLLEKELVGNEASLQWVRKIIKGVRGLDLIVNDMLTFTQDSFCDKTEVNFTALLTEVLDYARPQIRSKNTRIDITDVASNLVVNVDLNMMTRILLNLILNAVDAAGDSGNVVIKAGPHKAKDYKVFVSVSDDGCGIKPEALKKIFNPFFTTKDSGTGLGLAIVHRLIECHNGLISAINNNSGGATFTILLP
ncbi:MAG: hypothetical protein JEZ07_07525 [Phycisphaerae bacterium]|nr:hypothetical protein [Phycisphaerae bacterium]